MTRLKGIRRHTVDAVGLGVLGRNVRIHCEDPRARPLLLVNYGGVPGGSEAADLTYTVRRQGRSSAFSILRDGREPLVAADDGEFLFLFEKDLTIALQEHRRDLYFVHSAVLECAGKALMLVGAPGSGKSTTAWDLLHHGFHYLSDELGPVDLETLRVCPYPRALCLKDEPPGSHALPGTTLFTSRTIHVPVEDLPGEVGGEPTPLAAVFFLRYSPEAGPAVHPIGGAEAAARLLAHALNPLAHAGDGLDGAIAIARQVAAFRLFTGNLCATAGIVKAALGRNSCKKPGQRGEAAVRREHRGVSGFGAAGPNPLLRRSSLAAGAVPRAGGSWARAEALASS